MAEKGIEEHHLFLLYQSVVLCGIGYGLGLTLMSQTTLLKLDRVQNEPMSVILGTIKDTLTETMRFMLASHQWKTRQKVEQVKAYFSAVKLVSSSDWILYGPFVLSIVQSFESVLSFCPIRVAVLHTLSFTQ